VGAEEISLLIDGGRDSQKTLPFSTVITAPIIIEEALSRRGIQM